MRKSVTWLVILASLSVVRSCPAQFGLFSANNSSQNSRQAPSSQTGFISPPSFLGSGFRLRNLIPSFGNPLGNNRYPVARSTIPETNSKEFLQAFGYHKLR